MFIVKGLKKTKNASFLTANKKQGTKGFNEIAKLYWWLDYNENKGIILQKTKFFIKKVNLDFIFKVTVLLIHTLIPIHIAHLTSWIFRFTQKKPALWCGLSNKEIL